MKISLNDKIKVKLTREGLETYVQYSQECNERAKSHGCNHKFNLIPEIDKDGYSTFQLWFFIRVFGHKIRIGEPSIIENNKIIIGEDK